MTCRGRVTLHFRSDKKKEGLIAKSILFAAADVVLGSDEQIFGAKQQVPAPGPSD
jgi:hypothetical protein